MTEYEHELKAINLLEQMIEAYLMIHVSGGSLHVVLDEGSWDIDSIEFCRQWAHDNDDPFGELIAIELLKMPIDIISRLYHEHDGIVTLQEAFEEWRQTVKILSVN